MSYSTYLPSYFKMSTQRNTRAGVNKGSTDNASPKVGRESLGNEDNVNLIRADLKELKKVLEKTVKTDDIQTIVTTIVQQLLSQNNEEREVIIEKKVEERCRELERKHEERVIDLQERIDSQNLDIHNLKEQLSECRKEMRGVHHKMKMSEKMAETAYIKSNYNEQYSRKTNIKIYGVQEVREENTQQVTCDVIKKTAGVELNTQDIIAVHRIPGAKSKQPRPIILKLRNTERKAQVMKKRSQVKRTGNGVRLADDVTAANTALIKTLNENADIDAAWYFNGTVYGQCGDQRIKFDILDDINAKIREKSRRS
ncbi:hypothetical protein FSP39_003566 [Pinctada imbricata]|uniref:Uncharacterized protein n=1 Tax=Pinctada imbricata TaxID=66713 RepID=A0AA88YM66_PINIB|nr:hypothetical protein FSP39_003566 [Pinctada imbricata]